MLRLYKLIADTSGATAIEYALIASLISVAAIAGYESLGEKVQSSFNTTAAVLLGRAAGPGAYRRAPPSSAYRPAFPFDWPPAQLGARTPPNGRDMCPKNLIRCRPAAGCRGKPRRPSAITS
jgi:pilus assembly protein Flp/PilA